MEINESKVPELDPNAEKLALKLQAYMRSKQGELLPLVTLEHKKERYYWCVLSKKFILVNGSAEMYLLPWEKSEKGEYYIYSHYLFGQGAVILVPEDEIKFTGFN